MLWVWKQNTRHFVIYIQNYRYEFRLSDKEFSKYTIAFNYYPVDLDLDQCFSNLFQQVPLVDIQ